MCRPLKLKLVPLSTSNQSDSDASQVLVRDVTATTLFAEGQLILSAKERGTWMKNRQLVLIEVKMQKRSKAGKNHDGT